MPLDNPRSNFSKWYDEVLLRASIVDVRTPTKGANVLMPNGYEIWEAIKNFMNKKFKETGHKNAYFPLLIPEEFLQRESAHFEGFIPEVAWVTHVGNTKLPQKFALRPTSETIMYHMYAQWIHSHADLPLKYNQWCNIIRWDTKETRPLLRDREFFWSEAHTAHSTYEEAAKQVEQSMEIYQSLFDALCLSYLTFQRPDHDKFAGAEYTIAYDAPLPNGKVLQIGTTHHLGNNFAKPFDVKFLDTDGETKFVFQTSYGISTRLIASILSIHGDDQGLILPPKFAPTQIVIVPIIFKKKSEGILEACQELEDELVELGYRVFADLREQYTSGWKFSEWEMHGVPLRLEIGPRDLKNNSVLAARRDTLEKENVARGELGDFISDVFDKMAIYLKKRADAALASLMRNARTLAELKEIMRNNRGIVKSNWCEDVECAKKVKDETSSSILGTRQGVIETPDGPCLVCGNEGKVVAYIASSY
ncbi:MAG: proline--tRNA ligase [Candidatus Heimdallarchaeota archaeon]|nr:proline--tRNA ligase [Candidatus Heimdallarchaeota archaeon]